ARPIRPLAPRPPRSPRPDPRGPCVDRRLDPRPAFARVPPELAPQERGQAHRHDVGADAPRAQRAARRRQPSVASQAPQHGVEGPQVGLYRDRARLHLARRGLLLRSRDGLLLPLDGQGLPRARHQPGGAPLALLRSPQAPRLSRRRPSSPVQRSAFSPSLLSLACVQSPCLALVGLPACLLSTTLLCTYA
ncbi:uncharacterized protein RHOBADRAFT_50743, partial [Rhodotorula graminis WP1]